MVKVDEGNVTGRSSGRRSRRRLLAIVAAAVIGSHFGTTAAQATGLHLVFEAPLAPLARSTPMPPGATWQPASGTNVAMTLCGPSAGTSGRAALLARAPTRIELDGCRKALGREPGLVVLGREAVAVAGRVGEVLIPLTPSLLFRAIARKVPGPDGMPIENAARQWRDLDGSLPAQPIGVLLPGRDSPTWRVFSTTILDQGCRAVLGADLPFEARRRAEACALTREDGVVRTVEADLERAGVLATAASGTLAVLPQAALRKPGAELTIMPVANQLPTAAKIAADAYPGSRAIYLAYVVPRGAMAGGTQPSDLAVMLSAVVAEDSIGPYGAMAATGLVPLAPADRVALRERLASDLGGSP